mgnify:CR=1 FL=1
MLAERERQLETHSWRIAAWRESTSESAASVTSRGTGKNTGTWRTVKVEEAQQKLQEQAGRLESAFMNDFVAEIDENVREAKT